MRQVEELARLRVNEAIQNGIRSQHVHRILEEKRVRSAQTAGVEAANPGGVHQPRMDFAFPALRTLLLKIVELFVV